jgi:hypothetical protein
MLDMPIFHSCEEKRTANILTNVFGCKYDSKPDIGNWYSDLR